MRSRDLWGLHLQNQISRFYGKRRLSLIHKGPVCSIRLRSVYMNPRSIYIPHQNGSEWTWLRSRKRPFEACLDDQAFDVFVWRSLVRCFGGFLDVFLEKWRGKAEKVDFHFKNWKWPGNLKRVPLNIGYSRYKMARWAESGFIPLVSELLSSQTWMWRVSLSLDAQRPVWGGPDRFALKWY